MADRKLDVFELLNKLDRKNYEIWDTLSADQKKEFSPLVTMRWMAGMTDPFQLFMLNEVLNPTVFELPKHKELLLKLLATCSNGNAKRYSWVNHKVAVIKKPKKSIELIAEHYRLSHVEAEDTIKLFSNDEILELAKEMGLQKDELKDLQAELK